MAFSSFCAKCLMIFQRFWIIQYTYKAKNLEIEKNKVVPFFSMKFQNLITRFLLFRYPIYHYYYNEKSTFWCKALPFLLVLTQQIGLRLKFLKLHHDFPIWFKNKMAFSKISVNLNQALCPKSQCHVVVDGSNMCGKKPIDCCCCWLCWWGWQSL